MAKKKPAPKPAAKPAAKPKPKPKAPAKDKPKKPWAPVAGADFLGNAPGRPRPIDPRNIAAEGRNQSARDTGSVSEQLKDIYPQLARYQQGQIQYLGEKLDNKYTRQAVGQVNQSFGMADRMGDMGNQAVSIGDIAGRQISSLAPLAQQQANFAAGNINALAPQVTQISDAYMGQLGGLGSMLANQAASQFANAGPTALENQIAAMGSGAMGVRADQVSGPSNIREVTGADAQFVAGPQAAMARNVANVGAGQVGAGALGSTLMAQAMERAQSGGRLTAEANRDAVQAARAGMAARGMATGSAGVAAELLNRDRFARARQAEDNAFASAVQAADLERQFGNVANTMRADQGNQEVAARMALADQAAQNQMAQLGYQGSIEQFQAQAARNQQANLANQQRDQVLGEMAMRAQMANQAANMEQTAQNRQFMLNANNAFNQGQLDRRTLATNMATAGGNLFDTAGRLGMSGREVAGRLYDTAGRVGMLGTELMGNLYQTGANTQMTGRQIGGALMGDAARMRQSGAGMLADLDPYARAINPGMALGQTATNMGLGVIGNNMAGNRELIANAGSFNTNMQNNLYTNWMDNNAAIMGANQAAAGANAAGRASRQAGIMGMVGGIGGGVAAGAGIALGGIAI